MPFNDDINSVALALAFADLVALKALPKTFSYCCSVSLKRFFALVFSLDSNVDFIFGFPPLSDTPTETPIVADIFCNCFTIESKLAINFGSLTYIIYS